MTTTEMEDRLKQSYPDCQVAVIDLTGTSDHFEVRISEPSFAGLPRIQQHKKVMAIFANELASGEVHALAIKTINL
ncbi:MAG: BolA/IbaG family iron-sulfur metabolism protein [Bdellovibrionales bacterium]|nr:BolA/IbaG family iron-sulfur metabolism protein [Bdellovibrionales bacterium]